MASTFDDGAWRALLTGSEVAAFLTKSAIQVENLAKRLAPVDTGRLRSSITHSPVAREGSELVIRVGTNVEYAAYQEFGTSRMRPHPFLRPALYAVTGLVA